ncbi:MAG: NAD(P)-dependent oxidoreductase [Methylocystaceae bacterium]|nr:NAD(P)-dependent oxidoreductase [Methylocystaceae bacterium]
MSVFEDCKVAFIGFGEAASAFVKGWELYALGKVLAYDIKTDSSDDAITNGKWTDYQKSGVIGKKTLSDAISEAGVIFSLVTANQAQIVAEEASHYMWSGAFYFDCNSCAPETKRLNADVIHSAGGRYVDVAVMAPVYPKLHKTPISMSGVHSKDAKVVFDAFGMNATLVEGDVGAASSIKMIRSIMMKGMEGLFAECVLAGRRANVEEVVLDSLDKTYPNFDFKAKAAYMLERSMTHGVRRAAEMREVVKTVEGLGLQGDMAKATVEWQQRIGDLQLTACESEGYSVRADKILSALQKD